MTAKKTRQITERTGAFWTDQLNNSDQLTAYHTMADAELFNIKSKDADMNANACCAPTTSKSKSSCC